MLVLRAALAHRLARHDDAVAFVERVTRFNFANRALYVETQGILAETRSQILEAAGATDAAIGALVDAVNVYTENLDLVASGAVDMDGGPLLLLSAARLCVGHRRWDDAREALAHARQRGGETDDWHFAMSALEEGLGSHDSALAHYQQALRQRNIEATEVALFFGTTRRADPDGTAAFGSESDDRLTLGEAVVMVPGGQFSTEAWIPGRPVLPIPVGQATDAARLLIRSKTRCSAGEFADAVARQRVGRLYADAALVFVHGYNVTFDAALRRGAQLARDLNFDAPVFVYSWPSRGHWWRYGTDRVSADTAAAQLAAFLDLVCRASGAKRLHLVAHSMGNRVLLPGLAQAVRAPGGIVARALGEVVLASPAVPEAEFNDWIETLAEDGVSRVTLYASRVDLALLAGFVREFGTVLAGHVADGDPLMHRYVQSIDLSEAGGDAPLDLNHDVFATNPVVTEDMRQLLQRGTRPPDKRLPLLKKRASSLPTASYWYYE